MQADVMTLSGGLGFLGIGSKKKPKTAATPVVNLKLPHVLNTSGVRLYDVEPPVMSSSPQLGPAIFSSKPITPAPVTPQGHSTRDAVLGTSLQALDIIFGKGSKVAGESGAGVDPEVRPGASASDGGAGGVVQDAARTAGDVTGGALSSFLNLISAHPLASIGVGIVGASYVFGKKRGRG